MFSGETLGEMVLQHPLLDLQVPVLFDGNVDPYHGTGARLVCPAHDIDSLKLAFDYGLPKDGIFDKNGLIMDSDFAGMSVYDEGTNEAISKALSKKKTLYASWQHKNDFFESTADSERILLRSAPNWFIKVPDQLKAHCLEELSVVKFVPPLSIMSEE